MHHKGSITMYQCCHSLYHELWGHPGQEELEGWDTDSRERSARWLAAKHITQLHNNNNTNRILILCVIVLNREVAAY